MVPSGQAAKPKLTSDPGGLEMLKALIYRLRTGPAQGVTQEELETWTTVPEGRSTEQEPLEGLVQKLLPAPMVT